MTFRFNCKKSNFVKNNTEMNKMVFTENQKQTARFAKALGHGSPGADLCA